MKNNSIQILIIAILVGAAAFYGGMQYQKSRTTNSFRGQRNGNTGPGGFQGRGGGQGMAPVRGEILSADDTSVTVKMQDGSSKIVILSGTTTINKASEGSKTDLKTGETITAFGTTNTDGSVTAQNIAIGGEMFGGMRAGQQERNGQPTPGK